MTLIEDKLHQLHTTARETGTITSGIQRNSTTDRIPFASITTVTIGSPAAISVSNYTVIQVQVLLMIIIIIIIGITGW